MLTCPIALASAPFHVNVVDRPDSLLISNNNMSVKFSKHSPYTNFFTTADGGNVTEFSIGFSKLNYITPDGKKFRAVIPTSDEYTVESTSRIEVASSSELTLEDETRARQPRENDWAEIAITRIMCENDTSEDLGFSNYTIDGRLEVLSVIELEMIEPLGNGTVSFQFKLDEDVGSEHLIRTSEEPPRLFESKIRMNTTVVALEEALVLTMCRNVEGQYVDDGFAEWMPVVHAECASGGMDLPLSFEVGTDGNKLEVFASCEVPSGIERMTFVHSFGLIEASLPENHAPVAAVPPVFEIDEGDVQKVNLDALFSDPEGQGLSYSAFALHAMLSLDGPILSIDSHGCPADEKVTVTATDPAFDSTSVVIDVRIINPAPAISKPIAPVVISNVSADVIDLSEHFTGRALEYSAKCSHNLSVAIIGNSAIVRPTNGWEGRETVEITASNAFGNATLSFDVLVDLPNRPPTSSGIPMQTAGPDGIVVIDLSRYFSDPDRDIIIYSAYSPDGAGLHIDGARLEISLGTLRTIVVEITASDGKADTHETVVVKAWNGEKAPAQYLGIAVFAVMCIISACWLVAEYQAFREGSRSPVRLQDYRRYKKK